MQKVSKIDGLERQNWIAYSSSNLATSWLQRAKITLAGYSQGRTKYVYQFSQKIVFHVLIYVRAYRRVLYPIKEPAMRNLF